MPKASFPMGNKIMNNLNTLLIKSWNYSYINKMELVTLRLDNCRFCKCFWKISWVIKHQEHPG